MCRSWVTMRRSCLTTISLSCSRTLSVRTRLAQHSAAMTAAAPAAVTSQRWSRSLKGAHRAAAHRPADTTADATAATTSGRLVIQVFMLSSPHPWVFPVLTCADVAGFLSVSLTYSAYSWDCKGVTHLLGRLWPTTRN